MRSVAGVVEFLEAVMAVLGIGFGKVAVDLKREGKRGVNLEVKCFGVECKERQRLRGEAMASLMN